MAFELLGRKIERIGVVGSGNIGPDIALFFSTALSGRGVDVVVVDISRPALDAGKKRTEGKVRKLVEAGKMKPPVGEAITGSISWTSDMGELKDAALVVEAATESLEIKHAIFGKLASLCGPDTIFASNSSHMEPEVIFATTAGKGRTAINHFFFPAERNPVVEVVPGAQTDPDVTRFLMRLYEAAGKWPIRVKSRYGYAIDPVFEGLFQAAALCVEGGLGSVKEVDAVAKDALGLGVGSFTAMNLTGGNPLTAHGLGEYTAKIHGWFRTPQLLKDALAAGKPWETAGKGEKVECPPDRAKAITDEMRGAFFGLVTEIVGSGIATLADVEFALPAALAVKAPFAFMNELGVPGALALVEAYAKKHPGFPVPAILRDQAARGEPWQIPDVVREDREGIAILTIRRPAVLNALNAKVVRELRAHFASIKDDPAIKGAILTGFGNRAFVSGADINELAAIKDPDEGAKFSWRGQETLLFMEALGKPIVAAMGGLAFGGGCEIAMACTARVAVKTEVLVSQPEPKLGIIPGYGGTQRMPRWVGVEKCWKILRDGNPVSSAHAKEIGLVQEEVEGDVVEAATGLLHGMLSGNVRVPAIRKEPLDVPATLPDVDIGHLSRKIDEIIQRAILEGAKMTLEEGLRFEAKMFGECVRTEDMKIGMGNFLKNGPKVKAEFIHK